MLQVYTGNGKGKTTAAIGLACRSAGYGRRIAFFQFMKATVTRDGEYRTLSGLPGVRVERYGKSLLEGADAAEIAREIRRGLAEVEHVLESGEADLLVLDEANVVCATGLVTPEEVLRAIERAGPDVEIVITGRGAPEEILRRADLVTEMVARKHPFEAGVPSRKGVEF